MIRFEDDPAQKAKTKAPRSAASKVKKVTLVPPGTGLTKPMLPSEELAAVVGSEARSRPQMMKVLWAYIKANNLQVPSDKRQIKPDAKLAAVLGPDPVTIFKLPGLLGQHLFDVKA